MTVDQRKGYTLVVDDDKSILKILQKYLKKRGHKVITANNGDEALHFFKKKKITNIVSDLCMPTMDGEDLLVKVREQDANIPFFIMTGTPDKTRFQRLNDIGVSGIFHKPFSLPELEHQIFADIN